MRQAGSAGSKRISPATFGGTATIARWRGDADARPPRARRRRRSQRTRPHRRVEDDAVAEALGEPERDQLRAADDARVEAEVGLEQVRDAAAPATVASAPRREKVVAGFVM